MHNILKMFRAGNREVKYLRVSTLASYFYCSVRARCQALGIDTPPTEALAIGKRKHDEITAARQPSVWERELETYLKTCMVTELESTDGSTGIRDAENKVFMRGWYDGATVIGHIVTHGVDDWECNPQREVTLIEYKTTNQKYVDNYKLSTALFQTKLYIWILDPLLKLGGYRIVRGKVVYLARDGKPIGEKIIRIDESPKYETENYEDDWFVYNTKRVESEIAKILDQFEHPENLIPPARFKCARCPQIFKNECPFIPKDDKEVEPT